jgi:hypothetical protein
MPNTEPIGARVQERSRRCHSRLADLLVSGLVLGEREYGFGSNRHPAGGAWDAVIANDRQQLGGGWRIPA